MPGWGLGENGAMAVSFGPDASVQENIFNGIEDGVDILFRLRGQFSGALEMHHAGTHLSTNDNASWA